VNETQFCWWLKGILCMQEPTNYVGPQVWQRIASELETVLAQPKAPHGLLSGAQDTYYRQQIAAQGIGGHDPISRGVVLEGVRRIHEQNQVLAKIDEAERQQELQKIGVWLPPTQEPAGKLAMLAEQAEVAAKMREERRDKMAATFEGLPLGTPAADKALAAYSAKVTADIEADFAKADMSVLLKEPSDYPARDIQESALNDDGLRMLKEPKEYADRAYSKDETFRRMNR
jgi:hypothetical protein